jgi:hypothetical protein
MRNKVNILAVTAALLVVGGIAFEANATMGAGTEGLSAGAKSYSPVENASCTGDGLFCHKGSTLQCNPICVCTPCSPSAKPHRHKG